MFKQEPLLFKVLEIHYSYYKQGKEPMLRLPPCQQCRNQFAVQQHLTQLLDNTNRFVINLINLKKQMVLTLFFSTAGMFKLRFSLKCLGCK